VSEALSAHLIIAVLIIGAITVVQRVLIAAGDPVILEVIRVRYIFDIMDLGVLVMFLVFGTISAYMSFRDETDPEEGFDE